METATETDSSEERPTFDVLPLSAEVKSAVAELGYVNPTPVQQAVFESAVAGKDLVVQARTGTGKTAAFGLPLVDRLVRRKVKAVQSLVLCPTRELALQVTRELGALGKNTGIIVLPVYGGAPMLRQIEGLEAGAQILVGTPGRVLDHLRRKTLDASKIRSLVLDECDEMLSMGFLPQILDIWNQLPKQHQVLLFSATVPRAVLRVAESRLDEPEFITLSGDHVGALEIEHFVYISQGDKVRELLRILKSEAPESAIVFCNTRDDTQRVATELQRAGYAADWLNADLSQREREAVMTRTREGQLPFLVCTDVAARGIDISHLTHVINFDFPEATEQYVHRTGRTGRAGRMGTAISLVSPGSIGNLYYLRLEYKIHPIERQLPSEEEIRARAETDAVLRLAAECSEPRDAERSLVRRLLTHEKAEAIVAALLRERGELPDAPTPAVASAVRTARGRRRNRPEPPSSEGRGEAGSRQTRSGNGDGREEAPARIGHAPAPVRDVSNGTAEAPSSSDRESDPEPQSEPRRSAPRRRREPRVQGEPARTRESRTAPRGEGSHTTEEGFSYEVQPVSEADLEKLTGDSALREAPETARGELSARWEGPVDEVFINVGREDGARASDVEGALQAAGVAASDTAYVRVRQRHTFIGVKKGLLESVVSALNGRELSERTIEAQPARPRPARRPS